MFQTKVVEKIKTNILRLKRFFPENRVVYEITGKNIVEPGRSQTTIWRMRIAYWISKTTNTHSEHVITHCFSTAKMVMRTRLNLRYTCIACLDFSNYKSDKKYRIGCLCFTKSVHVE